MSQGIRLTFLIFKIYRMKRLFFVLAAAAAFAVSACNGPADEAVKPTVSVTEGEVTEASVTFTVTTTDAVAAAYICQEEGAAAPTAENVLAKGKTVAVNQAALCTEVKLKDNTTYVIYAAAMNESEYVLSAPTRMTTVEIPPQPAATITAEGSSSKGISFTVTPTEAVKCAYKLYTDGQEATAEDVLATGTEVSATEATLVKIDDLAKGEYYVVAAVQNGNITALSNKLSFSVKGAESINFEVNKVQAQKYSGEVMIKMYDANLNRIFVDYYHGDKGVTFAEGTYKWGYYPTSSDTPAAMSLWSYYTEMEMNGTQYDFTGGTSTVKKNDDGTYTLSFDLTRNDGKVLDLKWTGTIQW